MGKVDRSQIKEIYESLGDELSKNIFENRVMYSLTDDTRFIRNVVCSIDKGKEFYERLKANTQIKVIFGAGSVGKRLVRVYNDIKFECFVDNYGEVLIYKQLPVISVQSLKEKYQEALIIISTKQCHEEILEQLLREGFRKENIINIGMEYEKLSHMQYFDLPQLEERKGLKEVFVDGGCFDGNSSLDFYQWCLAPGGYVYAWEPDAENRRKCKRILDENGIKYELIPKGLWSEAKELKFEMDGSSSRISEIADISIQVDSIDRVIQEPVTYIKMDIEGAEYQGILGAKEMISRFKPKLAVCVYHKPEDIWELPQLIRRINSEYEFYLRHYSFGDVETVLYAL